MSWSLWAHSRVSIIFTLCHICFSLVNQTQWSLQGPSWMTSATCLTTWPTSWMPCWTKELKKIYWPSTSGSGAESEETGKEGQQSPTPASYPSVLNCTPALSPHPGPRPNNRWRVSLCNCVTNHTTQSSTALWFLRYTNIPTWSFIVSGRVLAWPVQCLFHKNLPVPTHLTQSGAGPSCQSSCSWAFPYHQKWAQSDAKNEYLKHQVIRMNLLTLKREGLMSC